MKNAMELERWAIGGLLAGLAIEGRPIQIVIPACSGNDDLVIAEAPAGPGDDMDVIMERARLIAAAPELLAACEDADLRLCQCKLAKDIGHMSLAKKLAFVEWEIERVRAVLCAAIALAKKGA